jgi:hypothetical protein
MKDVSGFIGGYCKLNFEHPCNERFSRHQEMPETIDLERVQRPRYLFKDTFV